MIEIENQKKNAINSLWQHSDLIDWSIVGMNHYHKDGERYIVVSMEKDGLCIKVEGPDNYSIWEKLINKALLTKETPIISHNISPWLHPDFVGWSIVSIKHFFHKDGTRYIFIFMSNDNDVYIEEHGIDDGSVWIKLRNKIKEYGSDALNLYHETKKYIIKSCCCKSVSLKPRLLTRNSSINTRIFSICCDSCGRSTGFNANDVEDVVNIWNKIA